LGFGLWWHLLFCFRLVFIIVYILRWVYCHHLLTLFALHFILISRINLRGFGVEVN
jgi:hypothetical protein